MEAMKGDSVARVDGGGMAAEADAAAAEEAKARRGSNASSDTMLDKLGFGTMLDAFDGHGCHIFIRGNRINTDYVTTRISNIYLV